MIVLLDLIAFILLGAGIVNNEEIRSFLLKMNKLCKTVEIIKTIIVSCVFIFVGGFLLYVSYPCIYWFLDYHSAEATWTYVECFEQDKCDIYVHYSDDEHFRGITLHNKPQGKAFYNTIYVNNKDANDIVLIPKNPFGQSPIALFVGGAFLLAGLLILASTVRRDLLKSTRKNV